MFLPWSLTGRSMFWLQNADATKAGSPEKQWTTSKCLKTFLSSHGQMSYGNKISRAAKIFYKCTFLVLQFCLLLWKQELCYSSSVLRQHFHCIKYCHFLHAYSKHSYTEPLLTYPAAEALAAVGWECKCFHLWFSKHLAFKIFKWLMQKLSKVIEVLLTPHMLPVFSNDANTWQQL